jgi:arginase
MDGGVGKTVTQPPTAANLQFAMDRLHVDFDVLDRTVMPAVDSPGSPGLDYEQLGALVGAMCASGRIAGADFTIYDPDESYAGSLVNCMAQAIRQRRSSSERAT